MKSRLFLSIVLVLACRLVSATWYVDKDNISGIEDGTSWDTAFSTIQPAIDAASEAGGGEVWVAEGVYDEARSSDPHGVDENTGSVIMKADVHLYGGFVGREMVRSDRDFDVYVTTLDGSTAREGQPAYHVIVGANSATLDGFTITGGDANGPDSETTQLGGGMYNSGSSPTLSNCMLLNNSASREGGGMSNSDYSSPTLTNCTISNNSAREGGGMHNTDDSSPTLTKCTFSNNSASGSGGGMNNDYYSSPTLINCLFSNNSARSGAGMRNEKSSPTLSNCTISNNSASNISGGILNWASSLTLTNCIVWGNTPDATLYHGSNITITYSNVQSGYEGEGNINTDPMFIGPANGNYHLRSNSPCIDTGTEIDAPDTDLDGISRPQNGFFEMGVYEFVDLDRDGMVDDWELLYGFDPADPSDATNDPDGDGLTNLEEFDNQADPFDTDTDDDGMGDWWEVNNGLDPAESGDADDDADDDGLTNLGELEHGSDPNNKDSDGDGMEDGWEVANGLDPVDPSDADGDVDGDGFPNLVEFELGTDPLDYAHPPEHYYVSPNGTDSEGSGRWDGPWTTIQHAVTVAAIYSDYRPSAIHLGPGTYEEQVNLVPNISISGAGTEETTIQYFEASADSHAVVYAAENSGLSDCTVTVPVFTAEVVTLVLVEDVSISMERVAFDGRFNPRVTGVFVSGSGSSSSGVHDSAFRNLDKGIWAINSGISISRNIFENILGVAVFISPSFDKDGVGDDVPQMGDLGGISSHGINLFRNIPGDLVQNWAGNMFPAHYNDWGMYTQENIDEKLWGPVDVSNYVGVPLDYGTIAVEIMDGETSEPITDFALSVILSGQALPLEQDMSSGLFIVPGVESGQYNVDVEEDGLSIERQNLNIGVSGVEALTVEVAGDLGQRSATLIIESAPLRSADVDGSDVIDSVDVQLVINAALGKPVAFNCDVSGDFVINAVDVQLVINAVLGL